MSLHSGGRVRHRSHTVEVDAVLFDMDGTLVDSHASIHETWTDFAHRHRLDPALVYATLPGRTARAIVGTVLPSATPAEVDAEVLWVRRREQHTQAPVRPIAGAAELIVALAPHRWAVVTAASAVMMRRRLSAAGLPEPGHAVTADDAVNSKPAPDGYLRAAALLAVAPTRCAVFEDSTAGLLAGHRAGSFCIAVGDEDGPADARVADLTAVTATLSDGRVLLRVDG
ncbi:HAD-IA family hydrolase [Nocardia higoensis]|uniref:HAD-IA family hydrolase n=1 Tax=Nocardia higoensis TaxID=228599 RepID=UPI000688E1F6|nr:HAD-IA family hydrolase [Nocardia higoensis]